MKNKDDENYSKFLLKLKELDLSIRFLVKCKMEIEESNKLKNKIKKLFIKWRSYVVVKK